MQLKNGKSIIFAMSLAFVCFFVYGFFTKINIEIVTGNNFQQKHLKTSNHQSDYDINKLNLNKPNETPETVTVILPLEEIKRRNRERAIDPLLKENVTADNKQLVRVIRDHFIDPPSKKQPKMSNPLVRTPQAAAVETILDKKVRLSFGFCCSLRAVELGVCL